MSYLCISDDIFSKISIKNVLPSKFPFFKLDRDATSPQAFPDHLGQMNILFLMLIALSALCIPIVYPLWPDIGF